MPLNTVVFESISRVAHARGRISGVSGHKINSARTHRVCLFCAILGHVTPRIYNGHEKKKPSDRAWRRWIFTFVFCPAHQKLRVSQTKMSCEFYSFGATLYYYINSWATHPQQWLRRTQKSHFASCCIPSENTPLTDTQDCHICQMSSFIVSLINYTLITVQCWNFQREKN